MAATPAWRSPIPGALASRPAFQSVESAADYSLYSLSHANLREQHAPGGVYLYSLFWKTRPGPRSRSRKLPSCYPPWPSRAYCDRSYVNAGWRSAASRNCRNRRNHGCRLRRRRHNVIADAGGRIRISIAVHRLGRRRSHRRRRRRRLIIGAFGAAAMVGAFSTLPPWPQCRLSQCLRRRRPGCFLCRRRCRLGRATFAAAALADAFVALPPWPLPPWLLPAPPPRSPPSRPPP